MSTALDKEFEEQHPFAGCTRLLMHYQQTGSALMSYERRNSHWLFNSFIPPRECEGEFSVAVSFVPVEVLESYLDDLLDLNVTDASLFIVRPRHTRLALILSTIGAIGASLSMTYSSADPTTLLIPALMGVLFLVGIVAGLYLLPRTKVFRRFTFATLLSHEISKRRGNDKPWTGGVGSRLILGEMLGRRELVARSSMAGDLSGGSIIYKSALRYFH